MHLHTCLTTVYICFWISVNIAESLKEPFQKAELLSIMKNILEDPLGAAEVKFSALGLICSLAETSKYWIFQN